MNIESKFIVVIITTFTFLISCSSRVKLNWNQEQGYRWAEVSPGYFEETGFKKLSPSQTHIDFENRLTETEIVKNRHYLNGSGVAAGDIDGDGLVDLYFAGLNGSNRLYKNLGGMEFRNITDEAGIAHEGYYSAGVVFADIDGDRDLDLLVSSTHQGVVLYLNKGNGRFEKGADSGLGNTRSKGNSTLALADIDGDKDLDLYVTNYRERSIDDVMGIRDLAWEKTVKEKYSKNRDDSSYTLLPPFDQYYTIVTRDNLVPERREIGERDQLFINNGNGQFTEVIHPEQHFLNENGKEMGLNRDWGLAAKFQDLNNDGLPDLYVCNDFWTPDRVWINQGDGIFKAIDPYAVRNYSFSSMAVDFSDINRDGSIDLFVTEMLSSIHERRLRHNVPAGPYPLIRFQADKQPQYNRNSLYLNRGDNTYVETSYYSGLEASEWSWATQFMDVDLDGYEDIIVNTGFTYDLQDLDSILEMHRKISQGKQKSTDYIVNYPPLKLPNKAFRNNQDLTFTDVSSEWGFDEDDISHGMATADLDQDGDLDVVVNRLNQEAVIYENLTLKPRIAVRLIGKAHNTQAIGAKVELTGGPVSQKNEVSSGGDYLSGSDPLTVFAADPDNPDHVISVTWPGGQQSRIEGVRANRIYEIDVLKSPVDALVTKGPVAPKKPVFKDVSSLINHRHHEESYDDFHIQPLLPLKLSRLGPGVSWIDFDNDRDDDLFIPSGHGGQMGVFENAGDGTFNPISLGSLTQPVTGDQTTVLGWPREQEAKLIVGTANYEQGDIQAPSALSFSLEKGIKAEPDTIPGIFSTTGTLAASDYDSDGDLDLFVGGRFVPAHYPMNATSRLFKNENEQFILDEPNSRKLREIGLVTSSIFTDIDRDGDPDLIISREWDSLVLFQNNNGIFQDVSDQYGLEEFKGWWNGIATGDFNNDGRPDIIATNRGENSPYQLDTSHPLKMYYQDFNRNGQVDVIEAYYDPASQAYVPRRQLKEFESLSSIVLRNIKNHREFANATLKEILGNDNFIPSKEVNTLKHTLFINEGKSFSSHPLPAEAQFSTAYYAGVADFDNDGNEDLFLTQNFFSVRPKTPRLGAGRGLWLKGDGKGNFEPVPGYKSGIKIYGEQRGAALSDFNEDGKVDLAVTQNNDSTRLFVNKTTTRGLRIQLLGPPQNSAAIGSSIRLIYEDGRKGPRREIQAGSGYLSQNSAIQVLGQAQELSAIEVYWFDGTTDTVEAEKGKNNYFIRYSSS